MKLDVLPSCLLLLRQNTREVYDLFSPKDLFSVFRMA